jgi:hypothetical protein
MSFAADTKIIVIIDWRMILIQHRWSQLFHKPFLSGRCFSIFAISSTLHILFDSVCVTTYLVWQSSVSLMSLVTASVSLHSLANIHMYHNDILWGRFVVALNSTEKHLFILYPAVYGLSVCLDQHIFNCIDVPYWLFFNVSPNMKHTATTTWK